jgi:hypothetical protein
LKQYEIAITPSKLKAHEHQYYRCFYGSWAEQ